MELSHNSFPGAANISIGKARTAAISKKPTLTFEDTVNKGRTSMTALKDFTPLQGGGPIDVEKAAGAIGVIGIANAQQDQEVALAGASAANGFASQSGGSASSPAPNSGSAPSPTSIKIRWTTHLQREAFYIGDGHNYQVLRSRRDKPGQLEVNTLDADVIYVLQEHATFITRGTLLDGKTISPNEIRAMQLNGLKSPLT